MPALCKVSKVHDDGDLSFRCEPDDHEYLLTTEGRLFSRVDLDATELATLTEIKKAVMTCIEKSVTGETQEWLGCISKEFEDKGILPRA